MDLSLLAKIVLFGALLAFFGWVVVSRYRVNSGTLDMEPQHLVVFQHMNESFLQLLIDMTNRIEDHFETEYDDNYGLFVKEITDHFRIITDHMAFLNRTYPGYVGWAYYVQNIEGFEDEASAYEITVQLNSNEQQQLIIPWNNLAHCIDRLHMLNKTHRHLAGVIERTA